MYRFSMIDERASCLNSNQHPVQRQQLDVLEREFDVHDVASCDRSGIFDADLRPWKAVGFDRAPSS